MILKTRFSLGRYCKIQLFEASFVMVAGSIFACLAKAFAEVRLVLLALEADSVNYKTAAFQHAS